MKLGIVITTYERPTYLKECLDSLKRADIPIDAEIIIVDDNSKDIVTNDLINKSGYTIIRKNKNAGICDSLIIGFNYLYCKDCAIMMNLDSDAIVRNDFVHRILELPNIRRIKTGFHCTTKNANGNERHKIVQQEENFNTKTSVGGINMCFPSLCWSTVRQSIMDSKERRLNWDHQLCLLLGGAVSVNTSVIQHIGVASSLGHHEQPDTADTFKGLVLPDVTLVCVDDNISRCNAAIANCTDNIEFGAVHTVSLMPPLGSKRAYSEFIMHEVYKYVDTSHMLIVQHDGYVKNWKAWSPTWLKYDYIGAPWLFHKDRFNVGNGGFSLRSRRIMELASTLNLQNDKWITEYNEDHNLCRIYRPYLESKGIKFAPLDVAAQFSIEGWGGDNRYRGQFGFHGGGIRF